jgi:hypothetical protein
MHEVDTEKQGTRRRRPWAHVPDVTAPTLRTAAALLSLPAAVAMVTLIDALLLAAIAGVGAVAGEDAVAQFTSNFDGTNGKAWFVVLLFAVPLLVWAAVAVRKARALQEAGESTASARLHAVAYPGYLLFTLERRIFRLSPRTMLIIGAILVAYDQLVDYLFSVGQGTWGFLVALPLALIAIAATTTLTPWANQYGAGWKATTDPTGAFALVLVGVIATIYALVRGFATGIVLLISWGIYLAIPSQAWPALDSAADAVHPFDSFRVFLVILVATVWVPAAVYEWATDK